MCNKCQQQEFELLPELEILLNDKSNYSSRSGETFEKRMEVPNVPSPSQRIPQPINPWTFVPEDQRILYVMEFLVNNYRFPVNAAAGIAGNFKCESLVLANRIEGSNPNTPMRATGFDGRIQDFTPNEVMNRNAMRSIGPRAGGIGIAQWTYSTRRRGLFQHVFRGQTLGEAILYSMEGQVDYFISEIRQYRRYLAILTAPKVILNNASDLIAYYFMTPGSIIEHGRKLPQNSPQVQALFQRRRRCSNEALRIYKAVHP